jgi:hypothetical protein
MICNACGRSLEPNSRFCPACGSQFETPTPPRAAGEVTVAEKTSGKALASLILGVIGLLAWCLPILGLPITITGIVLASKSLRTRSRGLAIAGLILCIVGLVFSVINMAWGAYLGATGQHPLLK